MSRASQIRGLTPARHRVIRAVQDHWDEWGFSPSIRGLMRVLKVSSTNAMSDMLKILEREQLVTRVQGVPRSIVITDKGRKELREWETQR